MTISIVYHCSISASAELTILLAEGSIGLLDQDRVLLDWRALVIRVVPANFYIKILDGCSHCVCLEWERRSLESYTITKLTPTVFV